MGLKSNHNWNGGYFCSMLDSRRVLGTLVGKLPGPSENNLESRCCLDAILKQGSDVIMCGGHTAIMAASADMSVAAPTPPLATICAELYLHAAAASQAHIIRSQAPDGKGADQKDLGAVCCPRIGPSMRNRLMRTHSPGQSSEQKE